MAELHGAVLDRVLAEVDLRPGAPAIGWRARLAELLVAYTELLFAHPSLARSVMTMRPSGPNYVAAGRQRARPAAQRRGARPARGVGGGPAAAAGPPPRRPPMRPPEGPPAPP